MMYSVILVSIVVAVCINLVLPQILNIWATDVQIKPPQGAAMLSYADQLMHMFVHHAQVPLSSSIIMAVVVGISVFIASSGIPNRILLTSKNLLKKF